MPSIGAADDSELRASYKAKHGTALLRALLQNNVALIHEYPGVRLKLINISLAPLYFPQKSNSFVTDHDEFLFV